MRELSELKLLIPGIPLVSCLYFKPRIMSLCAPPPFWTTARSSTAKVIYQSTDDQWLIKEKKPLKPLIKSQTRAMPSFSSLPSHNPVMLWPCSHPSETGELHHQVLQGSPCHKNFDRQQTHKPNILPIFVGWFLPPSSHILSAQSRMKLLGSWNALL